MGQDGEKWAAIRIVSKGMTKREERAFAALNVLSWGGVFFSLGYAAFALEHRRKWRQALDEQLAKGMAKGYVVAVDHHRRGFHILPTKPSLRLVKLEDTEGQDSA